MYLSSIKINGFRLFSDFYLEFNRGLNVLVGENDSGKTALVDAIRHVLGTNSAERTYMDESDFCENCSQLTIQLKFRDVDNHAYRFVEHLTHEEIAQGAAAGKRRSVLYVQLTARKTGTERRGYPFIQTEIRSGQDGNGLPLEAGIRNFLAATYLKPLRDAQAELSTGRASRLSQILGSSKKIRADALSILKIVAEANKKLLSIDGALRVSASQIETQYLHELIFESDKTEIGAHIDIAGVKSEGLDELSEQERRRFLRAVLEGLSLALTTDRRQHGLGYHNLLFMAAELLLLEQESEAENEFPLLLIEEPEAHLHPQLQMKLLEFVRSKVGKDGASDAMQCILSTHSPNLSSKADPSEVIMLAGGKAWALRPGETELDSGDYVFLKKFLDVTKTNVFFAKGLLFVEGDSENILLPIIARLLDRPLEDFGVSIVKYDNSGSWKRFAKLFLRSNKDDDLSEHHPTRVGVLRDLDLWPAHAEKISDGTNPYGFKERTENNAGYWEVADPAALSAQIAAQKTKHKRNAPNVENSSLERQNVKVFVSDRWTFEFCLARYGLFSEACEALGEAECEGDDDLKATFVQKKVRKTDFAYQLAAILEAQLSERLEELDETDEAARVAAEMKTRADFAVELRQKLPPYIVDAIAYVTNQPFEDQAATGDNSHA